MVKSVTRTPSRSKSVKKPTVNRAVSKKVDVKWIVPEVLSGTGLDETGIYNAIRDTLRYNNYFYTYKEGYEWLLVYAEKTLTPQDFKAFKKSEDWQATITVCALAKMMNHGFPLDDKSLNFLKEAIDNMVRIGYKKTDEKVKTVEKEKPENSLYREIAYDLEAAFDDHKTPIDVRAIIGQRVLSKADLDKIVSYWQELLESVNADFKDKEAKQGYRFLKTASDFKGYISRIEKLITDLTQAAPLKVKAPRKARTPKAKSAEQIAAKVKYQATSQTYGLTSLMPSTLVGAKMVLLFNVKLRTLTLLRTSSDKGFGITGTTITDYDEKNSFKKILRKPQDVLPEFKSVTKARVERVFNDIKTTAQEANGRTSTDTIILRVY